MKKFFILLVVFVLYLFVGCSGNKNKSISDIPASDEGLSSSDLIQSDGSENSFRQLANNTAIHAAFRLDYTPLKAEPVSEVETLSASALSGSASSGSGQGNVTGGGLRKLSDYKTVYFDPVKEAARVQEVRAGQESRRISRTNNDDSEPLTVIDWGPRGEYSSAIQRPSIYVIFSQPMIPLASLGEQSASSSVVSISPAIRGVFRWYGTGFLSFEGEEPCLSQQEYKITVASSAVSLNGAAISGERVFSFVTESLGIRSVTPGEEFREKTNFRFDNNNVPPDAAKSISILFNYPVQASDINQYLQITTKTGNANAVSRQFRLRQADEYKIIADLSDSVNFDTQVTVTLKAGARSRGASRGTESDRSFYFRTPALFSVTSHNRRAGYGKYSNIVEVYFSHSLSESSARNAVRTEPSMEIDSKNIEVYANTLRISNLPVNFGASFTLTVGTGIEDIYGRKLGAPYTCVIVMPNEPPPRGDVNYLDYRTNVMLEAQFKPQYLFQYENITRNSYYQLAEDKNPFLFESDGYYEKRTRDWSNVKKVDLPYNEVNTKYFELFDLAPYLNKQGKGFVRFFSSLELLTSERQNNDTFLRGTRKDERLFSIQVTDLGMTVRYGFNKAVILVTSLSTGKPVEGAKVTLLNNTDVNDKENLASLKNYGSAVTGSNGLAVINLNSSVLRNHTMMNNYPRVPFVMAEKDGDKAIFNPYSHNMWRSGVNSDTPQSAEEVIPVAFLFSDRGLYKPGETITFRGVDRSRVLGIYALYHGDYSVVLEENNYRPQRIAVSAGTTTDSGSFFGSLPLPEDLTPGSYRLVYRRIKGETEIEEIIANVPITVAFFERLRFQASLSAPPEAVVLGDDLNLTLRASYLSGGSLSGASWECEWYEEMTVFSPETRETRDYTFGPLRGWDSSRYLGSESGSLSGQGTATLSRKTGGSKITGAPYQYRAEARVTDIGNQMVAARRSVTAHPASFYIGLGRSSGGFVRSGQEFSCNFLTVNTLGEKTSGNVLFLQKGAGAGQLKVELIREEWRRVQQRGVSGYINDEYVLNQVTDSIQMVNIQSGTGTIKVKPSAAGMHILRVSSKDREGRDVLTEMSFYVTGSGGYWNMSDPTELRLVPDQDVYEPGDTAKVLLQSPLPSGYYLITVERDGIFSEEVRHITESVSVLDIKIARNYVPIVYVAVSSYSTRSGPPKHEYGDADLDKPNGFFGVTRLNVNTRTKAFSVSVQTDKKTYRPGDEVTMTLTATRDGSPLSNAELSLMAVDRGVLDLINYRVPDPIEYFYSNWRFPLYVYGGDSRSMLTDPVTYNIRQRMGGDSEDGKIEERKDFNPTAVFEPMLITDENGKVTCKFKLPDNLTTYRVTVFGVRGDLFSLKESEIAAQNRINVREVVPRRLRERDTAEAGVLITNLDSASHSVTVKLDIGNPSANIESSGLSKIAGQAFVDGAAERQITVRSGENAVVYFDVAAVKQGNITLNFTINSNILNEKLIREMIIERPYILETVTTTGNVTGSSANEGLVIPSFADNGVGNLSVTLDATRLSLLDGAVSYLFNYPFGCLEQRSSAVMPLVVFGEYLDALSIKTEVSNPRRVVENEMRSWAQIQLSNGGFPYWPSGTQANFYVSLRIAHVIAIAKQKGMPIPSTLNTASLTSYLNREYQNMQRWRTDNDDYNYQSYLQSYMLYVFALLGERVDASRLAEILSRSNVDPSVLSFAGMTYRYLSRNTEAAETAQRLRDMVRMTTRGADITDPLKRDPFNYYGDETEQLALTLQFFAEQYPSDEINSRLLYTLLENQRSDMGYWVSTAVTVRVLSAVDAFIKSENLENTDVRGTVTLAGTEILQGQFRGLGAKPVSKTFDFSDTVLKNLKKDNVQQLTFTRNGTGNLYYIASLRYAIPSEIQSFRDEGLGVFMTIYDVNTDAEIKGTNLQSGKTYRVRIRVSSARNRSFVALRVPVPSGAEILDMAFVTTASYQDSEAGENSYSRSSSWLSHQAIMDNEIQYFWDRFNKGESTVTFLFRTARRGVYPTPPAQAECMYQSEIFGRTKGLIYTIE